MFAAVLAVATPVLLMVLPALFLFFVAQRFFIEGIAMTGTQA